MRFSPYNNNTLKSRNHDQSCLNKSPSTNKSQPQIRSTSNANQGYTAGMNSVNINGLFETCLLVLVFF